MLRAIINYFKKPKERPYEIRVERIPGSNFSRSYDVDKETGEFIREGPKMVVFSSDASSKISDIVDACYRQRRF